MNNNRKLTILAFILVISTILTISMIVGRDTNTSEMELYIVDNNIGDSPEEVISTAEKLFTIDNINSALEKNESIKKYELQEYNVDSYKLDDSTGKYNFMRQKILKGNKDNTDIIIEIDSINNKANYLEVKITTDHDEEAIDRFEDNIQNIIQDIIGDRIANEILNQAVGEIFEYETASGKSTVTTLKNIKELDDGKAEIVYYIELKRELDNQLNIADITIENDRHKVFNWIPVFNNDITSKNFAIEFARLYDKDADFKVNSIELNDTSFDVNSKIEIQTIIGEAVYKSNIHFMGINVTDTIRDSEEESIKLQKTIAINVNLPAYDTEELALEKAKEFLGKLLQMDVNINIVEYDDGTEFIEVYGDNSPLIEVSSLTGNIKKSVTANGKYSININATLEDNTLMQEYNTILNRMNNGEDIDKILNDTE